MTNEEWDRKAEFLLNQQAKFEADMQELKQELEESRKISDQKIAEAAATAGHAAEAVLVMVAAVSKVADTVKDLTTMMHEGFRKVFESMKHTDDRIDVLVNSQIRTDENIRDTDKQLRDTDRRLRDLAALFERHIREDHEGLSGAEN